MSKMTKEQAEKTRIESIEKALTTVGIRSDTRRNMELLDNTCKDIMKKVSEGRIFSGGPWTVPTIVKIMAEKFPADGLSKSSIQNNTSAGKAYKEVISAWKNYSYLIGAVKTVKLPDIYTEDLNDTFIQMIEPKNIRLAVLGMRTALRNLRSQLQISQMVDPAKYIYSRDSQGQIEQKKIEGAMFSEQDVETAAAFLDPVELGVYGLSWNNLGQLENEHGETVSRPGLKEVLEKAIK